MILVIGATGQLGSALVSKLLEQGKPVRAFVRTGSEYAHLEDSGAELAFGDLRDPLSIANACKGVETVIATATGISPRPKGGDLKAVDDLGYRHLIDACRQEPVGQFIFASVPKGPDDDAVPLVRYKRLTEQRLIDSGVPYTIFRLDTFADIWPALIGSSIPQRGAVAPSLARPFWFLRAFRSLTGTMIESRGRAAVPGRADMSATFITIENVASVMANAVDHPEASNQVFSLGGTQVLTWDQTIDVFSRVLGRPVKASYSGPAVFRTMQFLLRPVSASASSIMGLNWMTANGSNQPADPDASRAVALRFGTTLTGFEEFLRAKAAIQAG